jgi:hypothetical protein
MFILLYLIFASRYAEEPQEGLIQNRTAFLEPAGFLLRAYRHRHHHHAAGRRHFAAIRIAPELYTGAPQALEASMSLGAIFVMGSPVVLALCRLFLNRPQEIA